MTLAVLAYFVMPGLVIAMAAIGTSFIVLTTRKTATVSSSAGGRSSKGESLLKVRAGKPPRPARR